LTRGGLPLRRKGLMNDPAVMESAKTAMASPRKKKVSWFGGTYRREKENGPNLLGEGREYALDSLGSSTDRPLAEAPRFAKEASGSDGKRSDRTLD